MVWWSLVIGQWSFAGFGFISLFPSHSSLFNSLSLFWRPREKGTFVLQSNTMSNPDTALVELRAAVAVATTPTERANALNQLAQKLEQQGHYTESLAAAEEAYGLAKQAEAPIIEVEALRLQGVVYLQRGEYSKALRLFEQILKLYEELGDRSGVAIATNMIGGVSHALADYNRSLEYFTRALALFEELGDRAGVANVTTNIGIVYVAVSDYNCALEYYTCGLALHEELCQHSGVANTTNNIGIVYESLSDYNRALEHYTRALALFEELGNRSGVANTTNNIGGVYESLLDYNRALEYYTRALAFFEELGKHDGVARVTGHIGNVYINLLDYNRALEYYTHALALHEELGMRSNVALVTGNIGMLYANKQFTDYNPTKAEELLTQAIALNEELGTKQKLYSAYQFLANLYSQEGRWEEAFQQFKKYHELYQEVQSEEARKKALQVEQQRQIAEMEKRTAAERADAEATKRVLHNILPPTIAQRVVSGEERIAESFESVTVLFADIVGFTVLSQHISATELVSGLDLLFSQFDELAEKHGLEKIKTIGDAYMAVSGLPEAREDHAESAAKMAMEMVEVVKEFAGLGGGSHLQVRIGLHTGEVVAGIIGKKKFAYDLWGDAVNTAARMESHGEAGKIHVSEEFASAAGERFSFTERGEMEVKGKGVMRTFFLQSTSTP